MKQVIQSYKSGKVTLENVPVALCSRKSILVRNAHSLLSIGTEKSTIELGKKSLLGKARARPDLVKRMIEKIKTEGFKKTWTEAMGRLDTPTPLGYSAAGVVIEVGTEVSGFSPGDRVACIGQGFASHAEYVSVPVNLAVKLPDSVSTEAASFGMLGSIALHGIRVADLTFGARVGVIGLGLLGQLTVQILKAYGCDVFAFDINAEKMQLAQRFGADMTSDRKNNVDAVIVTAATTSSEPVDAAIDWCREKGRIVVVGVADIHPDRNTLWQKELTLIVSKAAGPGSLEINYEKHGVDYPINIARWTENRNLQEFIRLLDKKLIHPDALITHRFPIESAEATYDAFLNNTLQNPIGVLFEYPNPSVIKRITKLVETQFIASDIISVSVIGAGLYGKSVFLPALSKNKNVRLNTLVTSAGANAQHAAKRFGFLASATDTNLIFEDQQTDAMIALTPHDQHANLVLKALQHQKPLFIEKPLCVHFAELEKIQAAYEKTNVHPVMMVGHNRRFSPHITKVKTWLKNRMNSAVLSYRVNAGFVPVDHWVHSDAQGRSRIVGEMTHFIDLMQYVLSEKIISVFAQSVSGDSRFIVQKDNMIVTFSFDKGSVATLIYTAMGDRSVARETMEIFFDGKTISCHDFRESRLFSGKQSQKFKTSEQQLGYHEEINAFIAAIQGKENEVPPVSEAMQIMRIAFAVERSLAAGKVESIA